MRYLSKEEKAAKAEENRKMLAFVEIHHARLVATCKELFAKAMARPEYSEETKEDIRQGYEARMERLQKTYDSYVAKLKGSL